MITASVTPESSIALRLRCLAQRIYDLGPNRLFRMMCDLSTSPFAANTFERYGSLVLHSDVPESYGGPDLPPLLHRIK
jgi:hypothetical protein